MVCLSVCLSSLLYLLFESIWVVRHEEDKLVTFNRVTQTQVGVRYKVSTTCRKGPREQNVNTFCLQGWDGEKFSFGENRWTKWTIYAFLLIILRKYYSFSVMLIVASPQSLSEFPIFVTARGPGVTGDGEISINLNNYLPLIRLIAAVLLYQRRNQLK